MRRLSIFVSALALTATFAAACGDLEDFPDDNTGGAGGETNGSGGESSMGGGAGGADPEVPFTPGFANPPEGFPVELPEIVRTGGYSSDSAELRIIDMMRAVNERVTYELNLCGVSSLGADYYVDFSPYAGFCHAACMAVHENITCDDATTYVCDGEITSDTATDALAACLDECDVFACKDGSGMNPLRCDTFADCDDLSDEKGCGDFSYVCKNGTEVVSGYSLCDGADDCADASDEADCENEGFLCDDGTRIAATEQCDAIEDCEGGEDEVGCDDLLFSCGDDTFIPWYRLCNRFDDCADGSDEVIGCAMLDDSMCL